VWKTGSGFDPSHNGQGRRVLLPAEKFGHDPRIRRGGGGIVTQGTQPFHMLGLVGQVFVGKLLGGERLLQALGQFRQCQQSVFEEMAQDLICTRDCLVVEAGNHRPQKVSGSFLLWVRARGGRRSKLLGKFEGGVPYDGRGEMVNDLQFDRVRVNLIEVLEDQITVQEDRLDQVG